MKQRTKPVSKSVVTTPVFDRAMQSIAQSFQQLGDAVAQDTVLIEKMGNDVDFIKREMIAMRDDHRSFRETLIMHDAAIVHHDRHIEGLRDRVDQLEHRAR